MSSNSIIRTEQKFRQFVDQAPEALLIVQENGVVQLANLRVEAIFGFRKKTIQGKTIKQLIPDLYDDDTGLGKLKYLSREEQDNFGKSRDFTGRRKDGTEFPAEICLSVMHMGAEVLVTISVRDISSKKELEKELKASLYFLDNIIEHIPSMIFLKEADELRFVMFNKAGEELLGVDRKQLLGKNDYDFFPQAQADFFTAKDREVLENGLMVDIPQEPIQTKDKGSRILHTRKVPLYNNTDPDDDTRKATHLLGISEDITESKKADELMMQMTHDLQRSNMDLEQFAYIASHDLREPLRTISNFLMLLQLKYLGGLDEKGKQFLDIIFRAVKRMDQLVMDLLTYSRVERSVHDLVPVKLNDAVFVALQNLRAAVEEKKAVVNIAPDLPTVQGDAQQLVQLFQNLIANALKFVKDKAPVVTIQCTTKENKPVVMVRDNGIGIEPQYQQKIFEIFQRLHTRELYEGSGIGLAVCKKIVDAHKGMIWVESVPNDGAVFCVMFNNV